jgi:hypothetical protein
LSTEQARTLLDNLGRDHNVLLARHLAFEQAIAAGPLVAGNRVALLQNGGRFAPARNRP